MASLADVDREPDMRVTETNSVHPTSKRLMVQAGRTHEWLLCRSWAALALLLGAGMLCGTAVRHVIALVQIEVSASLCEAAPVTAIGEHIEASPAPGRAFLALQSEAAATRSGAAPVTATVGSARPLASLQAGVSTAPRLVFGHHQALSRHGPLIG